MGLLQDPTKALDQAEWYLANVELEMFPGAFELAAGNLCRQTLEQILFILCFYTRLCRSKYVRPNRTLHTAGTLIKQLSSIEATTGQPHWHVGRKSCRRIAKFAKKERSLRRWARELNEPSHFALRNRKIRPDVLAEFIELGRRTFDANDRLLIVAAVNELFSNGRMWVKIAGEDDRPCIYRRETVRMKHFARDDAGRLSLSTPKRSFEIIADNEVPRGPWPRVAVFPLGCVGLSVGSILVTPKGDPIDLETFETIIESFSKTAAQRASLRRRFKQLGFHLKYTLANTNPTTA